MKIIIVGISKLGEYLAKNLVRDGNEVTIIVLSSGMLLGRLEILPMMVLFSDLKK
ncbi:MAG: hypothetical protein IJA30_06700 [Bacilli bacterium]|nr:hypothetical protein [Bacilli bacterium]